jgi:beta-glucanase (GH16 family)
MNKTILFFLVILSYATSSCSVEEGTMNTEDPVDLVIEVNVAEDGSGIVTVQAQAKNVVEYSFDMDEASGPGVQTNVSGYLEYTYSSTGSYQIEVKAYGSSGRFVKNTKSIVVQVGEVVDPAHTSEGYSTPLSYPGMNLVWLDEFNGNSLNTANWSNQNGDGCPSLCGWGNNELEYYRSENNWIEDGCLFIEAREESFGGREYTSSRLISQDNFSFTYGRVDIRAILPKGQGLWPALWMLGSNITTVGWPKCGEIDIMELVGGPGSDDEVHGTLHWENEGTYVSNTSGPWSLNSGTFADEFHVFSITWNSSEITWYVDDIKIHSIDITDPTFSAFHTDFYFILNVAVGGNWPGSPDATTVFPQQMRVDYIRVFKET